MFLKALSVRYVPLCSVVHLRGQCNEQEMVEDDAARKAKVNENRSKMVEL